MPSGHTLCSTDAYQLPGECSAPCSVQASTERGVSFSDLLEHERWRRLRLQSKLLEVVELIRCQAPELNRVVRDILVGE